MKKTSKTKLRLCVVALISASITTNVIYIDKYAETKRRLDACEKRNVALLSDNNELHRKLNIYDKDYVLPSPAPRRELDIPLDIDLQNYIWELCCSYDIANYYELVFAVIRTESNFNASTISSTCDYGLMQVNKVNHGYLSELLGINDFLDPYQNVHGGIYLLSSLLNKYELSDALMAYNMGESGASKLWDRGIHTTQYTEKVLSYYKEYI